MSSNTAAAFEIDIGLVAFAGVAIAACVAATTWLLARVRRGVSLVPARVHRPVPWAGRDVLVIVLGFVLLANAAGAFLGPDPPLDSALAAQLGVVVLASALACGWLVAGGATSADLGFAPFRPRDDMLIAVVGLGLVVAPLLFLNAWLNTITPYEHPVIDLLTSRRDTWGMGLVIATACVSAPVGEELFFRRVLQGWLEKAVPSCDGRAGIAIASLAFAAAHAGQGLAFVPLFPLGVVLGVLASRTGSIVPCILLHALFNAVSVGLLLATPSLTE